MGKHSARDGQDGRDNGIPGAPGAPGASGRGPVRPVVPGSGRRRRGQGPLSGGYGSDGYDSGDVDDSGYDSGHDTGGFPRHRPQDHSGPPPAHPEHREHAAWGPADDWAADTGRYTGPPRTRELPFDLVDEWAEDWEEYDTASALRSPSAGPAGPAASQGLHSRHTQGQMQGPGRLVPRPRQEFVDAFGPEEPNVPGGPGAPGAPGTSGASGPGDGPGPPGSAAVPGPRGPAGDGGRTDTETAGAKAGGKADPRSGGKGRTLSGVAAAAVVTVLAVVVAGQVHSGDKQHSEAGGKDGASRSADDEASRSQDRPSGAPAVSATPSVTPTPPTYDQQMAKLYPLDPKLQLGGAFSTVGGHQAAPGKGKVMRFRVDIERGLPLDSKLFSDTVFKTLNDSRSWGHGGSMSFERVSTGPADIVVTLASPGTTAKWCAKSGLNTTIDNVSCDSASTPRTMINAFRWAQGAETFGAARMHEYRQMLINHEVGHRLGHGHVGCPKQGAPAPVMMQQTKFLSLDGGPTCRPNAWPFP